MKLWIDDMKSPPDDSWTWAKSYQMAICFINSLLVKEISFDHDLGEAKTGYDIAYYIEQRLYSHNDLPMMDWKIHSATQTDFDRIQDVMEKCDELWYGYRYGC